MTTQRNHYCKICHTVFTERMFKYYKPPSRNYLCLTCYKQLPETEKKLYWPTKPKKV